MKKLYILIFVILFSDLSYSQTGNSPYPVIFIHGLNSDDMTWNTTLNQLSNTWNLSSNNTFHAVLNARGGDTTEFSQDVIFPLKDVNGNIVNSISNSDIFSINFGNFWNRDITDPRIILYNNSTPGSNQNASNQSAIIKQGYALKIMIDSVLNVTGAEKVILAAHSMGGLAIREYLQRRENGFHKWWIDPNDTLNGHKVAKVITIGSPHQGTNVTLQVGGIDFNSEAIRDMRSSFSGSSVAGYIFGNLESAVPSTYYNKDQNCNGTENDTIIGINSGTIDNVNMSLPDNIQYTWIMSNYLGLGTDLAVPYSSQAIYNGSIFAPPVVSDTIRTNKNHIQETSDSRSLIRALDEPDTKDFAYDISFNKSYAGFITLQSKVITADSDYYKLKTLTGGKITVTMNSVNAGVTNISLLNQDGSIIVSKNISNSPDSIIYFSPPGEYFLKIIGNSNQNLNLNSYSFNTGIVPAAMLNLTLGIEGFWDGVSQIEDTVRVYLTNSFSPFEIKDSAFVVLNSSGNGLVNFIHTPIGYNYVKIIHRNALELWSKVPMSFTGGIITDFDFTSDQEQAFGNNQILKSGRWCIYSGDTDRDGIIDVSDQSEIDNDVSNITTGYVNSDLTGDSFVDLSDASIADNNGFNFVSVIKP